MFFTLIQGVSDLQRNINLCLQLWAPDPFLSTYKTSNLAWKSNRHLNNVITDTPLSPPLKSEYPFQDWLAPFLWAQPLSSHLQDLQLLSSFLFPSPYRQKSSNALLKISVPCNSSTETPAAVFQDTWNKVLSCPYGTPMFNTVHAACPSLWLCFLALSILSIGSIFLLPDPGTCHVVILLELGICLSYPNFMVRLSPARLHLVIPVSGEASVLTGALPDQSPKVDL